MEQIVMSTQTNPAKNTVVASPPPQIATPIVQTVSPSQNHDATHPVDGFISSEHIQQLKHVDDKQSQMEESLKRSVTLVIWYKPNCDPIRFTHQVSTFPLFQLTHFPSLITDLELTPESYLDAYNVTSGYWEQHMVTTVRTIESEQRLLYKVRKSLLSGLADDVCRGFSEELDLQSRRNQHASGNTTIPPTSTSQLKRPLSAGAEIPSTKRLFVPESYPPHPMCIPSIGYMIPSQTVPYTAPLASPPIVGPSQVRNEDGAEPNTPTGGSFHGTLNTQTPIISQTPLFTSNTPGISIALPTRLSLPQHSHPPTKRWPNDYIVSEIATGFRAMDAMSAQSSTVTQRMAFERVFNCRYVKSTVCRHRAVYRKADPALRTLFEGMGNNENASWGEFVKRVEGRSVTAEKSKGSEDDNGGLRVDLQGVACQQNPSLSSDTRADPGAHQILASMDQPRIDIPPDPLLSEETGAATFTPSVHEGATVD